MPLRSPARQAAPAAAGLSNPAHVDARRAVTRAHPPVTPARLRLERHPVDGEPHIGRIAFAFAVDQHHAALHDADPDTLAYSAGRFTAVIRVRVDTAQPLLPILRLRC